MNKDTISCLERGENTVTRDNLEALAKVFDLDLICTEGYEYLILHYDEFIERLKDLVKEYGCIKLSKKLEVHNKTIENWIKKDMVIKIKTYERIKDRLEECNLIP